METRVISVDKGSGFVGQRIEDPWPGDQSAKCVEEDERLNRAIGATREGENRGM